MDQSIQQNDDGDIRETGSTSITVGTDCSGIDSLVFALHFLGTPYEHLFSSEIDEHCLATIVANHSPTHIYHDITRRDLQTVPEVDLYAASIPCQFFSSNSPTHTLFASRGSRELARLQGRLSELTPAIEPILSTHSTTSSANSDTETPSLSTPIPPPQPPAAPRTFEIDGSVLEAVLLYIQTKKPNMFILEFIPGIRTWNKGIVFTYIRHSLENDEYYHVYYLDLNTLFYGIPQNRKRLFVVGIAVGLQVKPLNLPYPEPLKIVRSIDQYVDHFIPSEKKEPIPPSKAHLLQRASPHAMFIELGSRAHRFPNAHLYAPTLLRNNRMWCIPQDRYITCREAASLQGFDQTPLAQVVSDTQFKKQLGNATSLNVLVFVLQEMFKAIGADSVLAPHQIKLWP